MVYHSVWLLVGRLETSLVSIMFTATSGILGMAINSKEEIEEELYTLEIVIKTERKKLMAGAQKNLTRLNRNVWCGECY